MCLWEAMDLENLPEGRAREHGKQKKRDYLSQKEELGPNHLINERDGKPTKHLKEVWEAYKTS